MQPIEVIGVFVAAKNGDDAGAPACRELGKIPVRRPDRGRPAMARGTRSAMPSGPTSGRRMNSLLELNCALSKAAVIFLVRTAGKQNGRSLSSLMVGVARVNTGRDPGFKNRAPREAESYATSRHLNLSRQEYGWLKGP